MDREWDGQRWLGACRWTSIRAAGTRPQEAASLSQLNASLLSFLLTSGPRRIPGYSKQKSQRLFYCQGSPGGPPQPSVHTPCVP